MRGMRRVSNAILMVTLVKPTVRWTVARWRKRAQESAATTIGVPVQELFEAALLAELAPSGADLESSTVDAIAGSAGRSASSRLLIGAAVLVLVAGSALAVAAVLRRRRGRDVKATDAEWVAVPVEASTEDVEGVVAEETLIE